MLLLRTRVPIFLSFAFTLHYIDEIKLSGMGSDRPWWIRIVPHNHQYVKQFIGFIFHRQPHVFCLPSFPYSSLDWCYPISFRHLLLKVDLYLTVTTTPQSAQMFAIAMGTSLRRNALKKESVQWEAVKTRISHTLDGGEIDQESVGTGFPVLMQKEVQSSSWIQDVTFRSLLEVRKTSWSLNDLFLSVKLNLRLQSGAPSESCFLSAIHNADYRALKWWCSSRAMSMDDAIGFAENSCSACEGRWKMSELLEYCRGAK